MRIVERESIFKFGCKIEFFVVRGDDKTDGRLIVTDSHRQRAKCADNEEQQWIARIRVKQRRGAQPKDDLHRDLHMVDRFPSPIREEMCAWFFCAFLTSRATAFPVSDSYSRRKHTA